MKIDRQIMELRLLLANSVSKKEMLEYTAKIKELQYIKKMIFDFENYKLRDYRFLSDNAG
jgi:hypothetical protein